MLILGERKGEEKMKEVILYKGSYYSYGNWVHFWDIDKPAPDINDGPYRVRIPDGFSVGVSKGLSKMFFKDNDPMMGYELVTNNARPFLVGGSTPEVIELKVIGPLEEGGAQKNLDVTIKLTSEDTFSVNFKEPESGSYLEILCHDKATDEENRRITDEIRSWVSLMRDNI